MSNRQTNNDADESIEKAAPEAPNDEKTDLNSVLKPAIIPQDDTPSDKAAKKQYKIKKRSKHYILKRTLITVLCVLLALVLAAVGTFCVMYYRGRAHFKNIDKSITSSDKAELINDDGTAIRYESEVYEYNDNIACFLLLGVDRFSLDEIEIGKNGQADAVYLLVLDTEKKTACVLALSRDAMAEVDTFNPEGKYLGIRTEQICRAYAYGKDPASSCENMKLAVSRTLYNIPIHSYIAIDMEAIPKLTDMVNGVTVPEYAADLMTPTGNKIDLTGKNALPYIRHRSKTTVEANNARMDRQKYFIDAFSRKFIAYTKDDITMPLSVYNTLDDNDYMETDVTASQVTYLAKNFIRGFDSITIRTVPGTVAASEPDKYGKTYAEFTVDKDALYDIILELFYIKKSA